MTPVLLFGLASGVIGLPILAIIVGVVLLVCGFNETLGLSREPMKEVVLPVCRVSLAIIGIAVVFSLPDSSSYWVGCLCGAGVLQILLELCHQAALRNTAAADRIPRLEKI